MPRAKASCPICMDGVDDPVCIPCGHVFCTNCLKEYSLSLRARYRDTACPTCRKKYTGSPIRLFLELQDGEQSKPPGPSPSSSSPAATGASKPPVRPAERAPPPPNQPPRQEPQPFALARPLDPFTAHYLKTYKEEVAQLKNDLTLNRAELDRLTKEKRVIVEQNRTLVAQRNRAAQAENELLRERQQQADATRTLEQELSILRGKGERLILELQQRDDFIQALRRANPILQALPSCCPQSSNY